MELELDLGTPCIITHYLPTYLPLTTHRPLLRVHPLPHLRLNSLNLFLYFLFSLRPRPSLPPSLPQELCIGCGICVKKCPFEAVDIINLPKDLGSSTTHRYGPNSFKLHRLPMPRPGQVLGLVGTNGTVRYACLRVQGEGWKVQGRGRGERVMDIA